MSFRPAYTVKDENHFIPRDFLRDRCGGYEAVKFGRYTSYTANYQGVRFMLIDTSAFGGTLPDWILENRDTGRVCWLEVKTQAAWLSKHHGLKPAELWLSEKSDNFRIIVSDVDMLDTLDEMVEVQEESEPS